MQTACFAHDAMFVPERSCASIRAIFRFVLGLLIACVPAAGVVAATFTVNSVADVVDASPGDGVCRTAPDNTVCTLRAAIMESNANPGSDTINLQANTTYILSSTLNVIDSVTIAGAGPVSTIIDGNGAVTGDRVMQIHKCIGNATPNMDGSCPGGAVAVVVAHISGVAFRHGLRKASENGVSILTGGGGIRNDGTLTLENCAIADNSVDSSIFSTGGGIYSSGSLTVNGCSVTDNTLGPQNYGGAGIYSGGPLTVLNSTISGNVGTTPPGYGGGILVAHLETDTAIIIDSTISGNSADTGGGIYEVGYANVKLNLVNTTISGNFSQSNGGGLYAGNASAGLYNVTVASNAANFDKVGSGSGGGVFVSTVEAGNVTLSNSILTNNYHRNEGSPFDTLDDCSGTTFTSQGNNIVTHALCTIAGSYLSTSALLGPLRDNGGHTLTHALLGGSKAIDAGVADCTDNLGGVLATDQRGVPRPSGPSCDLGAYELVDIIFQDGFDT